MGYGHSHRNFLLFFFLILLLVGSSSEHDQRSCTATCGETLIRYPFRLDTQDRSCGRREFVFICRENKSTILSLSSSTQLNVSEIDYNTRSLLVSDPHHCLHKHLLHLNLSSSPFYMPKETLRYSTYLNCSENVTESDGFARIPCLSGIGSQIYVVNSSRSMSSLPPFCESIGTVSISTDSYQYIPILQVYVYSNSSAEDRLFLTWNQPQPARSNAKLIIIGLIVGGGCTVAIIMVLYYRLNYRLNRQPTGKLKREDLRRVEKMLEDYESLRLARYSYASIKRMTQNFKQKIGSGGYGCVYRGMLRNEVPVAIKILQNSKSHCQDFINEIASIGRVHHVNVVRLLGFCSEDTKRALIYEFMPNESLEKFILYREGLTRPWLGWRKLEEIAIGIARGIEYLHDGCSERILHLDIKPHNILLDQDFNPKISDFGLAKISSGGRSKVDMGSSRGGTMGYIAPEIVSRTFGVVSHKSDVYSFGMLLLEMAGGRKKMDPGVENSDQVCFPEWAYDERVDGEKVEVDIELATREEEEIERKLTIIGLWCIQWNPNDRPSMKKVIKMLQGEAGSLQRPPKPYFMFQGLGSEFFR